MIAATSNIPSAGAAVLMAMLCSIAVPGAAAALPNRTVNISDDEVREIQSVMPEVAIVLGTTGCGTGASHRREGLRLTDVILCSIPVPHQNLGDDPQNHPPALWTVV